MTPASVGSIRGYVGRRARAIRRAFTGPPPEGALVHERLPLPAHLIALDTDEGLALLDTIDDDADYYRLHEHYVPQRSPSFCGPATLAIVLNALHAGRHAQPRLRFDQDSVFTARTEALKRRDDVVRGGMGLPVFAGFFGAHGASGDAIYASEVTLDAFRECVVPLLLDAGTFVAVNFHRPTLGQEGTGHISPLAAYHAGADRFLVLDVSRHRYPPVWARGADLFAAMDTDAGPHSRGFVLARL